MLKFRGLHDRARGRAATELRNPGDVEVKLIPEQAAGGRIWPRLERLVQKRGQNGQSGDHIAAQRGHPINETFQVSEIAEPLASFRVESIKRQKDTPRPCSHGAGSLVGASGS